MRKSLKTKQLHRNNRSVFSH